MSEDYRQVNKFPEVKTFTAGTAGIATEVFLPNRIKQFQIGSESGKIYFKFSGEDGQLMNSTDRGFIPASNLLPLRIGTGRERRESVFISGASGLETIVVVMEE